ncbi:MAG: hypothetical protein J7530_17605, partial [Novosphingobium sp.]|nr:hypothetical protein [Novosphingobium sp.]
RAIEIIRDGKPTTPFMACGDTIRMEGRTAAGWNPFGTIEQTVEIRNGSSLHEQPDPAGLGKACSDGST